MSRQSSGSSTRRNAEALLSKTKKREWDFKLERERESEALSLKTARLRELRLAKEAAEQVTSAAGPSRIKAPRPRRSKQT
jgi:hypothetical protein